MRKDKDTVQQIPLCDKMCKQVLEVVLGLRMMAQGTTQHFGEELGG